MPKRIPHWIGKRLSMRRLGLSTRASNLIWVGMLILLLIAATIGMFRTEDAVHSSRKTSHTARLTICVEIGGLKKQQRLDAWKNWNQLDQTLRLLHLKRTPEIVAIAREQRDQALAHLAPIDCRIFSETGKRVAIRPPASERLSGLPLRPQHP